MLKGTEKQIAYAEDIRKAIFEAIEMGKEVLGEEFPQYETGYQKLVKFFNEITEAKVFINVYRTVLFEKDILSRLKQLYGSMTSHARTDVYRNEYELDEDISKFFFRSMRALRKRKQAES